MTFRTICAVALCGFALAAMAAPGHAGLTSYRYDALGRLTKAGYATGSLTNQTDVTYTFDVRGNRTEKAVTYGAQPAPVATDDSIGLSIDWVDEMDGTASVSGCLNVLLNDSDVDGDTLTVTAGLQPGPTQCYSAVILIGQLYAYTDSFNYTVSDGRGGSDTAVVNVSH